MKDEESTVSQDAYESRLTWLEAMLWTFTSQTEKLLERLRTPAARAGLSVGSWRASTGCLGHLARDKASRKRCPQGAHQEG